MILIALMALAGSLPQGTGGEPTSPPPSDASDGDDGADIGNDDVSNAATRPSRYVTPYRFHFVVTLDELLFDATLARGKPSDQSSVPESEWSSAAVREKWGAWGPPQRQFACPESVLDKISFWKRRRVLASASRFVGFQYQHHHIPDWMPPPDWPWTKTCASTNGRGVDCSNFTAFNYNWGLGIHLSCSITRQASESVVSSSHGKVTAEVIRRPDGEPDAWFDQLVKTLQPGDLLYIRSNDMSKISHVVMWMGDAAVSEDGTPLVIDSHGGEVLDRANHVIPCGIYLRPFRKGSWYHRCFDHAHRWVK